MAIFQESWNLQFAQVVQGTIVCYVAQGWHMSHESECIGSNLWVSHRQQTCMMLSNKMLLHSLQLRKPLKNAGSVTIRLPSLGRFRPIFRGELALSFREGTFQFSCYVFHVSFVSLRFILIEATSSACRLPPGPFFPLKHLAFYLNDWKQTCQTSYESNPHTKQNATWESLPTQKKTTTNIQQTQFTVGKNSQDLANPHFPATLTLSL